MIEGEEPIPEGRVLVKDGRIMAVEPPGRAPTHGSGVEILDATEGIILPGLVNTHCHTAMTLFRGYADDLPLREWLFEKIFPAEARFLNPETVYWGTLLGCLEMIASGTTCLMDGYFFEDTAFEAVKKSGLRALMAQGIIDFPAPGVNRPEENLQRGREYLEKHHRVSERVFPGLFCHSPVTCSTGTLQGAVEISREFGLPLQIHLSETRGEVDEIVGRTGLRPVFYLDSLGVLAGDLVAAHAVHLSDDEIDLLSERGVKTVHVPESNMKLASGAARVDAMIRAGLRVGLGTDGCASNNNLDMFREMDSAAKLAKVSTGDPLCLAARTVLDMATRTGADVMGLGTRTGTLERGKCADIVVLDTHRPNMQPLFNPYSALVYSATGADVRHVIVDGRVLLKDRSFQTLDYEEILERVTSLSRTLADSQSPRISDPG